MDVALLLAAVSANSPCGDDLEYDADFLQLERDAQGKPERTMGDSVHPAEPPQWRQIELSSIALLQRSKDLRITHFLLQSALALDGFSGLANALTLISDLLGQYWPTLYPQLDADDDNDPTVRINALSGIACDTNIRLLRESLLTRSRTFGPVSLRAALNASGLFMESRLLAGENPTLVPDLKANLLRVISQILPGLPGNVSYDGAAAANTLARAMPSFVRNALGTLGLVSAPSVPSNFPLPSRTLGNPESKDDLETLLKLAAGAISRLQSHQLGGLEQTRTNADGTQVTTWQLEIPMRNAHDVVPLQVKLQREDAPEREESPETAPQEVKEKEKLWRVELAFDLEPLGPLQVQAQLIAGSLSSQMWAQREGAAELISSELDSLRARLVACGLNVKELACNRGVPAQGARTVLEQRWIDENA